MIKNSWYGTIFYWSGEKIFWIHLKCLFSSILVDGGFGAWGAWGACSEPCGGGRKTKTRSCNNPPPSNGGKRCQGISSSWIQCNTQPCPGKNEIKPFNPISYGGHMAPLGFTGRSFCGFYYNLVMNISWKNHGRTGYFQDVLETSPWPWVGIIWFQCNV